MIKSILMVGVGSFLGGALRYLLSTLIKSAAGNGFPWGTLAVNLAGCFLFGVVYAIFAKMALQGCNLYLLLTTGVLGGFTTFSAFTHEAFLMLQSGNYWGFISYVAASVGVGLLLLALGYFSVSCVVR